MKLIGRGLTAVRSMVEGAMKLIGQGLTAVRSMVVGAMKLIGQGLTAVRSMAEGAVLTPTDLGFVAAITGNMASTVGRCNYRVTEETQGCLM